MGYELALNELIKNAFLEDIGAGDFSTLSTIDKNATGKAVLKIKQDGILAGMKVAEAIFKFVQADVVFNSFKNDGDEMKYGETAFEVNAKVHTILSCERLVLNSMQRMCGIATLTRKYVHKLYGFKTKLLDTRKTTPNFRLLEKEAVKIGGGVNHRFGLYDMIMLKDNHIDYVGGIEKAITTAYDFVQNNRLNLKIETIEKTLAKVPDKQKIERTISSLQNNDMENKKNIEDKEKQILDLKQKNIANEEQLKKLKSELLDNENKNKDNKTYLFVLFKWSTEKHDLDLTVVDPQKRLFSFKKKSYPGASGLFSLDSRTGPGAEIWQANNPVVGRYTVIIKMYNNYGNLEPAQLSGSILSNKTSIAIADKTIDSKSGSQLEIIFDIDEKGFIKMQ